MNEVAYSLWSPKFIVQQCRLNETGDYQFSQNTGMFLPQREYLMSSRLLDTDPVQQKSCFEILFNGLERLPPEFTCESINSSKARQKVILVSRQNKKIVSGDTFEVIKACIKHDYLTPKVAPPHK